MRSMIVGQIHDSILCDTHKSEVRQVQEMMQEIITVDLPATWSWVQVPLTVEMEGSDVNWYLKKPLTELIT